MIKSAVDTSSDSVHLHACSYCGKSFTRRSYLLCHVVAHRSPALECDACHRQFGRVDSLGRHRCPARTQSDVSSSESTTGRRHSCTHCHSTYSRRATLLQHLVRRHRQLLIDSSVDAHPCSACRGVFVSALSLHNHQVVRHGVASLSGAESSSQPHVDPSLCPAQQDDDDALTSTRDSHDDTDSQSVSAARRPSVSETRSTFTCQFCGRTFASSGWLGRHVRRAHVDHHDADDAAVSRGCSEQSHVCHVCGKCLSSVGNLNKHLLTHDAPRHTCHDCGRQFHQPTSLRQHRCDVHAPAASFAVECRACGLRMRSRNSLYAHTARFHHASSQARHVCHVCGRAFHQRGNLVKHQRTHDDSVYVCRDCPRRLRSAERLRRHERWHEHGAQLTCAHCTRSFVEPRDLRRHIAFRHSNDNKTYRCCYCGVCCRHYQVCSTTLNNFIWHLQKFCTMV